MTLCIIYLSLIEIVLLFIFIIIVFYYLFLYNKKICNLSVIFEDICILHFLAKILYRMCQEM